MEDPDLSRRLRDAGTIRMVPATVLVSGRRFLAIHVYYTFLVNVFPPFFGTGGATMARAPLWQSTLIRARRRHVHRGAAFVYTSLVALPLGTVVGKYRIVRVLAERGSAVVYEATDAARGERVSMTMLTEDALANSDDVALFQHQASSPTVLDVGKSADGLPYMVTPAGDTASVTPAPKPVATHRSVSSLAAVRTASSSGMPAAPPAPAAPRVPVASPFSAAPPRAPPVAALAAEPPATEPMVEDAPAEARGADDAQAAPSVRRHTAEPSSRGWIWVVAIPVAAGLIATGGWFLGRQAGVGDRTPVAPPASSSVSAAVPPPPRVDLPAMVPSPTLPLPAPADSRKIEPPVSTPTGMTTVPAKKEALPVVTPRRPPASATQTPKKPPPKKSSTPLTL